MIAATGLCLLFEFKPDYVNAHYNLACADAESGNKKDACKDLENAFYWAHESGGLNALIEHVETDTSMEGMKKYSGYKRLVKKYKKKAGSK